MSKEVRLSVIGQWNKNLKKYFEEESVGKTNEEFLIQISAKRINDNIDILMQNQKDWLFDFLILGNFPDEIKDDLEEILSKALLESFKHMVGFWLMDMQAMKGPTGMVSYYDGDSLGEHLAEVRTWHQPNVNSNLCYIDSQWLEKQKILYGNQWKKQTIDSLVSNILAVSNRLVYYEIYRAAKISCNDENRGILDLSDIYMPAEELVMAIEKDRNAIGKDTRRARGNFVIVSENVKLVLETAEQYSKVEQGSDKLLVGQLYEDVDVFVDPFTPKGFDSYVVGYRGALLGDAGISYSPYTFFAVNQETQIRVLQRAAFTHFVPNPGGEVHIWTENRDSSYHQNPYYRKAIVKLYEV